jgi:uncharacterized alpha-E superfamily protein
MLSRVADSLYWMGRYLERAEHMARLLEVTRDLLVDLAEVDPEGAAAQWQATVATLGVRDVAVEDIVFDIAEHSSLASCMFRARENARQVREVIAAEMWEHINQSYWALQEARSQVGGEARIVHALTNMQSASFLWDGVSDASMRRGEGLYFLKLGKSVERTEQLSRTIGVRVAMRPRGADATPSSQENVMWLTLLRAAGALEAYRKEYPTRVDSRSVLEFLVFDADFPRAIRYSAQVTLDFATRLSVLHGSPDDAVGRAFGKMSSRLAYGDVEELMARGTTAFLNDVLADAAAAGALLARKYFLQ